MTSREYQKFADALKSAKPAIRTSLYLRQWKRDVEAVADVCVADNSRFDRNRFYAACEMDVTANT